MENDTIPRTKSPSSIGAADTSMDDGQKVCSDVPSRDAEEHVEDVSEKAEMSYEEGNAASLAMSATYISSAEAEQDEPVKESTHEILTGTLVVEERSLSSDAIISDVDPKRQYDYALEVNDIKRDEIFDIEVWKQKSLINFVCEHIFNCVFVLLTINFWNRLVMHMEKLVKAQALKKR